VHSDPSL
jgi:hypothetical protein